MLAVVLAAASMQAMAAGPDGSMYVTGSVEGDAFVARVEEDGRVAFVRRLGGRDADAGRAVVVDGRGIWVAGLTTSTDFPVTDGSTYRGHGDAFLARVALDGSRVEYAGLLGGSNGDDPSAVAIAADGSVVMCGMSGSNDLPGAVAPFGVKYSSSGFVARFDGSRWTQVVKLQGIAHDVAVARDGSTYVAGASPEYMDVTDGSAFAGGAYLAVLTGEGRGVRLGWLRGARATSVAVTSDGGAWVTTADPAQVVRVGVGTEVLGESGSVWGLAVDAQDRVWMMGRVVADGIRATEEAPLRNPCSLYEAYFVRRYSGDGRLEWSSFVDGWKWILGVGSSDLWLGDDQRVDRYSPGLCAVHGASLTRASYIAPGQVVTVFGSGLGGPVWVNETEAEVLYRDSRQVNFVVPRSIPVDGFARVDASGRVLRIWVVEEMPGLFSSDGRPYGQAAALNEDGSSNGPAAPAAAGSVVTFFATGLGRNVAVLFERTLAGEVVSVIPGAAARIRVRVPEGLRGLVRVQASPAQPPLVLTVEP